VFRHRRRRDEAAHGDDRNHGAENETDHAH
jgi:hypothetical protein